MYYWISKSVVIPYLFDSITCFVLSMLALRLWKLAFISRKRVVTFPPNGWMVRILSMSLAMASVGQKPGSEPLLSGWSRPAVQAKAISRTLMTSSKILDTIMSRTMIQKKEGES